MPQQDRLRNRLLSLMSPADFALFADHLEPIELPIGFVLAEPGQPFDHVYFIELGMGSIIALSPEGNLIEAGIYGRDGFGPTAALVGADQTPHRHLVQVAGRGHRISRQRFAAAVVQSTSLANLMMRFMLSLHVQTSFTALSNTVHPMEERLARWLLMCHDRSEGDEIPLTHEFMSVMLAVRRPSVTTALHVLEGNGFIRAERGWITIRDREAMEAFAADAYGKPEAEDRRLIGPLR